MWQARTPKEKMLSFQNQQKKKANGGQASINYYLKQIGVLSIRVTCLKDVLIFEIVFLILFKLE